MRIVYGVHGYGRGHAVRSLAVLSELVGRHEVLVLAGRDAIPILAGFPTLAIPGLGFGYRGSHLSTLLTLRGSAQVLSGLALANGPVATVEGIVRRFEPDVVVSDSEPLVLRAAGRLGVPRIGLDHVGIIAWCRPSAPPADALQLGRDAAIYRILMGRPERVMVSSFFEAPARRRDVTVIPPVLRERVRRAVSRDGGHLLVYFNRPALFTPKVLSALAGCGVPAIVYGTGLEERQGDVHYRKIDEAAFVEDLASARAVLATSGHQLASEALHLGKPMLLCPEDSAEQRLNARELVRLGVARSVGPGELSAQALRGFLARAGEHRGALSRVPRDGNARAIAVLEAHLRELATAVGPRGQPSRVAGGAARREAERLARTRTGSGEETVERSPPPTATEEGRRQHLHLV